MPQVVVSIIIVSYNTCEMTLNCLRSVFDQTRENHFEVIVLDNASSDGSADAIEREFRDRIRFMRSADNVGFARANNEAAKDAHGDYLLLLNPDTVVLNGAIDHLIAYARTRPGAGIWGGRTLFGDGSLNPTSCWARQTLWSAFCRAVGLTGIFPRSSIFNSEAMGGWQRDSEREVDIVTGCFFLIERALWERLGGFDPAFFMYGEEADLCLRARKMGARPHMTPSAEIIHYGGASEPVRTEKMIRLLKAKCLLMQRHWPISQAAVGTCLLSSWCFSRWMFELATCVLRGHSAERAAEWRSLWMRRREWTEVRPSGSS